MDVAFGGRYYQACYANLNGVEGLVTFCGDEPEGNPSVVRYLPGSSCETCMYRVGAGIEQVITSLEARPLRHLADAPWVSIPFSSCSRFSDANPAGICPHYGRDERVIIEE